MANVKTRRPAERARSRVKRHSSCSVEGKNTERVSSQFWVRAKWQYTIVRNQSEGAKSLGSSELGESEPKGEIGRLK